MQIRAIIFDLDGVLTDTAHYHFQAWQALAHDLSIPFTEQDNEQLKGVDRLGSLRWILQKVGRTLSEAEETRLMQQKNEHYLKLIEHMGTKDLFPGVQSLFTELKQLNIKIGLASASKNAGMVVERLGIAAQFDFIADANYVKNSKPDPEVFLLAAKGLGVTPEYCIGVEDAVAGIEAINRAGMLAIGIGDKELLSDALIVYPSIDALNLADLQAL
ncbi:beta-phosphoglucomutase [Alishewanella sp. SMS8]|uniref:beta-phosphoglucomutase n=1 Tax=Alishewanella sp. SMS8 TaxID=2994676 RepID=UPI002741FAA1|nr:beta-phosphoglucomutase [Alishewanella sp. SMS8]MDP5206061.1 beta-phosphoglucomutase [Alishewanella sp. SMS9]MDP5458535.1 beta-phosphoglucomutase [Alishewanella sp. SMS8]